MWILLLALLFLGLVTYMGKALFRHNHSGQKAEKKPIAQNRPEECDTNCGATSCEMECLVKAATEKIEYFDDEELDDFKQRKSNNYTEGETEKFREILYTMKGSEVPDWMRSLQLRDIQLPDALKDEVFMIVGEQRSSKQ